MREAKAGEEIIIKMMIMEKHRKISFVFNRFIYVNRVFPLVITLSLTSHLSFIL